MISDTNSITSDFAELLTPTTREELRRTNSETRIDPTNVDKRSADSNPSGEPAFTRSRTAEIQAAQAEIAGNHHLSATSASSLPGEYEILAQIGSGEHTKVYEGFEFDLQRRVAVKELDRSLLQDPLRSKQLLDEARFLASLNHPNIIEVYSVDESRGHVVMELMECTLRDKLDSHGALNPADVREILRQCLDALSCIHALGKTHGQISLANLLADDKGRVKISNSPGFSDSSEFRRPTVNQRHCAPEMLSSDAFGRIGPTVDLYCLGFAAMELLAGRKFTSWFKGVRGKGDANIQEWLRWHASPTESLPELRSLIPKIPEDVAQVIDGLTRKQVVERYSSAAEAIADLDARILPVEESTIPGEERAAVSSGGTRVLGEGHILFGAVEEMTDNRDLLTKLSDPAYLKQLVAENKILFTACCLLVLLMFGAVMLRPTANPAAAVARSHPTSVPRVIRSVEKENSEADVVTQPAADPLEVAVPPPPVKPIPLVVSDATVRESDDVSTARFKIRIEEPINADILFDYETQDVDTDRDDLDHVAGVGLIERGETSTQVEVTIHGDKVIEPDEEFHFVVLNVDADGVELVDGIGRGLIRNDDRDKKPTAINPYASGPKFPIVARPNLLPEVRQAIQLAGRRVQAPRSEAALVAELTSLWKMIATAQSPQAAEAALAKATHLTPQDPRTYHAFGLAMKSFKSSEKASEAFETARQLSARHATPFFLPNREIIMRLLHEKASCDKIYGRAIELRDQVDALDDTDRQTCLPREMAWIGRVVEFLNGPRGTVKNRTFLRTYSELLLDGLEPEYKQAFLYGREGLSTEFEAVLAADTKAIRKYKQREADLLASGERRTTTTEIANRVETKSYDRRDVQRHHDGIGDDRVKTEGRSRARQTTIAHATTFNRFEKGTSPQRKALSVPTYFPESASHKLRELLRSVVEANRAREPEHVVPRMTHKSVNASGANAAARSRI